jgi:hypothetical protein
MARLAKVSVNWTGFTGAPGYTNLYFAPAAGPDITQGVVDDAIAKVHTWIQAWDDALPNTVTLTVAPTVEEINDTNGTLEAFWTGVPGSPNVGGSTLTYSAVSGACVNWYTGGVRNGRRVRGRTFMVPIGSNGMQNDGTLGAVALTTWRTATDVLIANTDDAKLAVWSRPSAPAATDGISYDVNSFTINDKVAFLSSRRD